MCIVYVNQIMQKLLFTHIFSAHLLLLRLNVSLHQVTDSITLDSRCSEINWIKNGSDRGHGLLGVSLHHYMLRLLIINLNMIGIRSCIYVQSSLSQTKHHVLCYTNQSVGNRLSHVSTQLTLLMVHRKNLEVWDNVDAHCF